MPGNITGNPPKLDNASADGLLGVSGSVAYTVAEIERHSHHYSRFLVAAAVPSGEAHVADRFGSGGNTTPFVIDGGNDTWGPWVQVIGTSDAPIIAGKQKFDFHEVFITSHERNNAAHIIEIASGDDTPAAALAAEDVTSFAVQTGGGNSESGSEVFQNRRQDAGCKVWARVWAVGQNTGTLGFYIGLHEYSG